MRNKIWWAMLVINLTLVWSSDFEDSDDQTRSERHMDSPLESNPTFRMEELQASVRFAEKELDQMEASAKEENEQFEKEMMQQQQILQKKLKQLEIQGQQNKAKLASQLQLIERLEKEEKRISKIVCSSDEVSIQQIGEQMPEIWKNIENQQRAIQRAKIKLKVKIFVKDTKQKAFYAHQRILGAREIYQQTAHRNDIDEHSRLDQLFVQIPKMIEKLSKIKDSFQLSKQCQKLEQILLAQKSNVKFLESKAFGSIKIDFLKECQEQKEMNIVARLENSIRIQQEKTKSVDSAICREIVLFLDLTFKNEYYHTSNPMLESLLSVYELSCKDKYHKETVERIRQLLQQRTASLTPEYDQESQDVGSILQTFDIIANFDRRPYMKECLDIYFDFKRMKKLTNPMMMKKLPLLYFYFESNCQMLIKLGSKKMTLESDLIVKFNQKMGTVNNQMITLGEEEYIIFGEGQFGMKVTQKLQMMPALPKRGFRTFLSNKALNEHLQILVQDWIKFIKYLSTGLSMITEDCADLYVFLSSFWKMLLIDAVKKHSIQLENYYEANCPVKYKFPSLKVRVQRTSSLPNLKKEKKQIVQVGGMPITTQGEMYLLDGDVVQINVINKKMVGVIQKSSLLPSKRRALQIETPQDFQQKEKLLRVYHTVVDSALSAGSLLERQWKLIHNFILKRRTAHPNLDFQYLFMDLESLFSERCPKSLKLVVPERKRGVNTKNKLRHAPGAYFMKKDNIYRVYVSNQDQAYLVMASERKQGLENVTNAAAQRYHFFYQNYWLERSAIFAATNHNWGLERSECPFLNKFLFLQNLKKDYSIQSQFKIYELQDFYDQACSTKYSKRTFIKRFYDFQLIKKEEVGVQIEVQGVLCKVVGDGTWCRPIDLNARKDLAARCRFLQKFDRDFQDESQLEGQQVDSQLENSVFKEPTEDKQKKEQKKEQNKKKSRFSISIKKKAKVTPKKSFSSSKEGSVQIMSNYFKIFWQGKSLPVLFDLDSFDLTQCPYIYFKGMIYKNIGHGQWSFQNIPIKQHFIKEINSIVPQKMVNGFKDDGKIFQHIKKISRLELRKLKPAQNQKGQFIFSKIRSLPLQILFREKQNSFKVGKIPAKQESKKQP